jgi:hypothetical protein
VARRPAGRSALFSVAGLVAYSGWPFRAGHGTAACGFRSRCVCRSNTLKEACAAVRLGWFAWRQTGLRSFAIVKLIQKPKTDCFPSRTRVSLGRLLYANGHLGPDPLHGTSSNFELRRNFANAEFALLQSFSNSSLGSNFDLRSPQYPSACCPAGVSARWRFPVASARSPAPCRSASGSADPDHP